MRAHRAFSLLARRLAVLGYPVLRFDFHGCGDSAGDAVDGDLQQWMADTGSAIDELKNAGRVGQVALVGLRLGASIAAEAATRRDDVTALVAWDPVVEGAHYLESLRTAHRSWMEAFEPAGAASGLEALGYPVSDGLSEELARLDLTTVETLPAATLLIEERQGADTSELLQRYQANGRRVDRRQGTAEALGATPTNLGKPWLPVETIQAIASWVAEVCP